MEDIYSGYSHGKILDILGEYAIYLRKSRADMEAEAKGEGESLARHEHILLDLANKKGLKIGKIYSQNRLNMKKNPLDQAYWKPLALK